MLAWGSRSGKRGAGADGAGSWGAKTCSSDCVMGTQPLNTTGRAALNEQLVWYVDDVSVRLVRSEENIKMLE